KKFYISEEGEKKVRKDFLKKSSLPKILIVTQKLLTGFDAPILYCMYLDKPMRDHVLLQAIARVNRPYEDEEGLIKPCGFVLDFVGIFEKLEKALAFDSDVVTSVIKNIDVLKTLFNTYMTDVARKYLDLSRGWDDKSKERAIEYFQDKETRESFFWFYKQVQSIYDILSPDSFLRPYMDDYQSLARLYGLILNAYTDIYVDREITAKTRELLQKFTSSGDLQPPGAIHELGPRELRALKDSGSSDTSKVLNLSKLIALSSKESSNPILRLIGERAESLRQSYEDRQITTQEALVRFEELAEDFLNSDKERISLGLDENSFAILSLLKPEVKPGMEIEPDGAREINALFESFPDYRWDEKQEQLLKRKLYKLIIPLVGNKRFTDIADALLRLSRE
ncbi:MAG: type I site-specific deoxyribonuclease, HsdR family, partial [Methanosaeta sp. NSM2]